MDPEWSNIKDMYKNSLAEIANLRKENQEIWRKEICYETKFNAINSLVKGYLEDDTFDENVKKRFRDILNVLEAPDTDNSKPEALNRDVTCRESGSGIQKDLSGVQIVSTKDMGITESENKSIMRMRSSKRSQSSSMKNLPNKCVPNKQRRRSNNSPVEEIGSSAVDATSNVMESAIGLAQCSTIPTKLRNINKPSKLKNQVLDKQDDDSNVDTDITLGNYSCIDDVINNYESKKLKKPAPVNDLATSVMRRNKRINEPSCSTGTQSNEEREHPTVKVTIPALSAILKTKTVSTRSTSNLLEDAMKSQDSIPSPTNGQQNCRPSRIVSQTVSNTGTNQIYGESSQRKNSASERIGLNEDNSSSIPFIPKNKPSGIPFFKEMIGQKTFNQDEHNTIKKICDQLQYHPLAMQMAAGYINADLRITRNLKKTIANYLTGIEEQAKERSHKVLKGRNGDTISGPIYCTWKMTMDKLKTETYIGASVIKMLNIISILSPGHISFQFLSDVFLEIQNSNDSEIVENVIDLLKAYKILSGPEKQIWVNYLVQKITLFELSQNEELLENIKKIVECIVKMLDNNKIPTAQMSHVESIWKHTAKNTELLKQFATLPFNICYKLIRSGRYKEAFEFCCKNLSVLESALGAESQLVLQMQSWKGDTLLYLGKYSEANKLLNKVYYQQKKLFGEEDEGCLWTAKLVGDAYHYYCSNYAKAKIWYQRTLEKRQKINGTEHERTIIVKDHIAHVLSELGKYNEATKIYKEVLEVKDRLMGPEHQETLITKFHFAYLKFKQNKHEEALRMFKDVLEGQERVLDLDHPETLTTKDWISFSYKCLGRIKESLILTKEVYEKRLVVLGADHPNTIESKTFLDGMLQME